MAEGLALGAVVKRQEGRRQPGLSRGQMAAQLHDLRRVEVAKKEFEEYVRQQVSPPPGPVHSLGVGEGSPGCPC